MIQNFAPFYLLKKTKALEEAVVADDAGMAPMWMTMAVPTMPMATLPMATPIYRRSVFAAPALAAVALVVVFRAEVKHDS